MRRKRKFVRSRVEDLAAVISPRGAALGAGEGALTFPAGAPASRTPGADTDRPRAESRGGRQRRIPPGSSCGTSRGPEGPCVCPAQGRVPPALAGPTRAVPRLHSPAPATWVPLRDLSLRSLPTCPPTGLAFLRPQPPCGVRGPGRRPGAESEARLGRRPEQPGFRAREKEGAPSPLRDVSVLCTWGRHAARGPSLRPSALAPPASALSAGQVGPPRFQVPALAAAGAGAGAGAGWGPGQGEGSQARRAVIG
ncbi:cuticle collagen rol-6-like [Heterocephalus glaber]|uniref:Cuticle collagen rol-6-like n=1 Tax=Heterocephalus glaber TaxID=10181 RepID=A0AAX6S6P4_HETGA|nr:cuticle collagen rol-6-like [Heterocephalus glaber]